MRVNIFQIPSNEVKKLRQKFISNGMISIHREEQAGWDATFLFSKEPKPGDITWAESFSDYFKDIGLPKNLNYYAVYIFEKEGRCFALSYGKSHFYLRAYCNFDYGIEVAKRIANEADIKQTASKRFQGKRKKDIRSYAANTRLDVESGESLEFLQAGIIAGKSELFGKTGKFGASLQLNVDIQPSELGKLLNDLENELKNESRFKLPRTTLLIGEDEILKYDSMLVDELLSEVGTTDFTQNSYDLYGIDFVFSSEGRFEIWCPKYDDLKVEELSIRDIKKYIADNNMPREDILGIRIRHIQDDKPRYTTSIKEAVDFIADEDKVLLTGGRWMAFNQDYLDFLDDYVRDIAMEETESNFLDITVKENTFNTSSELESKGYEVADKNFDIFKTRSSTPIEAWDLKKDKRVYAVKFGTAQKLNYVCDQANAVLELVRNRADVKKLPDFDSYCLWLGYRSKRRIENIADTGSIILKQKIESWARKCRELGVEPVIKISRHVKLGIDE